MQEAGMDLRRIRPKPQQRQIGFLLQGRRQLPPGGG